MRRSANLDGRTHPEPGSRTGTVAPALTAQRTACGVAVTAIDPGDAPAAVERALGPHTAPSGAKHPDPSCAERRGSGRVGT
ncbi:hypothetical protein [Nocardiopsis sp. CNT312]|uniref:hypothetical protein n=1 Tax=Nocardiopsis sp. CNT312 TaxID=1137268 RepID=UPI00048DF1EE|nr:hypothetical protein [Nocardiopsis sp. CNT312]